jgi:hypothetical protein
MRDFRYGFVVLAATFLCLASSASVLAQTPAVLTSSATPRAPNFNGLTLDGDAVSLQSYHGRPLVLIFWASW